MSSNPSFDRESFQELLANAFAVQESDIDRESLSAIVEVQRLIAKAELDADGTMHLIVDCARDVANADGIAVAVLQGNQLVYRAGSGVASSYVGRHAIASLVVSADTHASREILRVENAETDTRIEAAICRQFGGMALVMFLIYRDRAAVGLLQVIFTEPHAFQDREVRTYRLMAGLIEDAMSRAGALEPAENVRASLPGTAPVAQIADRTRKFPSVAAPVQLPASKHAAYQAGAAALALAEESQTRRQPALLPTMISPEANRVPWPARWKPGLAAVAAVLLLTCWIALGRHRSASPLRSSALPESSAAGQPAPFHPAKSAPVGSTTQVANSAAQVLSPPAQLRQAAHSRTAHRRVRVRKNEVDYVKDDVTIRYFTNKPASQRGAFEHRVSYIGDDVTVRYFTPSQR
ncbi:MAG: hypothetical protein WAU50_08525 [Candidatus Sulfotelmatobacter sp.]